MKKKFFALTLVLFSPLAMAHPGEHHMGWLAGIAHLLSEPDHLAMLLLAVVVGAYGALALRRRARVNKRRQ